MNSTHLASAGGVDLLLHLLSNIAELPVTKTVVKNSGMGKTIGSIEKHRLCAGTPNESAVKERVQRVKDAWQASVKARKPPDSQSTSGSAKEAGKRKVDAVSPSSPSLSAKRVRSVDETKKGSFSSLLKKVSGPKDGKDASPTSSKGSTNVTASGSSPQNGGTDSLSIDVADSATKMKKVGKRVKWSDHFGGTLTASQLIEGDDGEGAPVDDVAAVSWSDRKKRDRLREKELLSRVKCVFCLIDILPD